MRELLKNVPYPLVVALVATFLGSGLTFFIRKLAQKQPSDVRVIWYMFFLALVSTLIAAYWGTNIGAIDEKGNFHGQVGAAIDTLLKFMLSLNDDVAAFSAILALVLLPQFAGYLFSGLAGCASAPILVGRSFSLFTWGITKSFLSAAGVLMAISIYGGAKGWQGWDLKGATSMSAMSLMLLLVSAYMLFMYREMTESPKEPPHFGKKGVLLKISAWMSRNVHINA